MPDDGETIEVKVTKSNLAERTNQVLTYRRDANGIVAPTGTTERMYGDAQEVKRRKSDLKLQSAISAWPNRAADLTDAEGFVSKGRVIKYLRGFEVSGRPQDFADAVLGAGKVRHTANGKDVQLGWYVRPGEAGAPEPQPATDLPDPKQAIEVAGVERNPPKRVFT